MFNSFYSPNLEEKSDLTKSFDLLRNCLVLSDIVLVDIILLYKTTSLQKTKQSASNLLCGLLVSIFY